MTLKERIMYVFADYNTGAVSTEQAAEMVIEVVNAQLRAEFLSKQLSNLEITKVPEITTEDVARARTEALRNTDSNSVDSKQTEV